MEKMLHERLRKYSEDNRIECVVINGKNNETLFRDEAEDIADEIERDYIPKSEQDERLAHDVMRAYAEAEGMPFGDCETISEWLDRWFSKRTVPKDLDADGVSINIGDTVWPIESPDMKMTVESFQCIYGQGMTVNCAFEGEIYTFNACELTHRFPDSLEKLRDDIKRQASRYEYSGFTQVWEWHNRLAAIIERGSE